MALHAQLVSCTTYHAFSLVGHGSPEKGFAGGQIGQTGAHNVEEEPHHAEDGQGSVRDFDEKPGAQWGTSGALEALRVEPAL